MPKSIWDCMPNKTFLSQYLQILYLWFVVWFEVSSQATERELSGVPQFVAEMTITLYTKNVQIDVSSC